MLLEPDDVALDHSWICTRPPAREHIERGADGTAVVVTKCPRCGAEDREER